MELERTLLILKPDTIQRSLIGKIITRFEDAGFKIVAMKMVWPDEDFCKEHYMLEEEWAKNVYEKAKASAEKRGEKLQFSSPEEMGKAIQQRNIDFLTEGPVIAFVLEAPHAIEICRKMVGLTEPKASPPGTIRGDYATLESYPLADKKERVTRNLIHASDSQENAKREISLWFEDDEIHSYSKELDRHFN